jgi:competence protein ComEC
VTPPDTAVGRLDVRLVPAALSSWAVTAAGILWQVRGSVVALVLAIAATAAVGRWASGRRGTATVGPIATGVVAVAVVGAGFALAIGLRVGELRDHPIVERYGSVATVVVTPSETPRSLGGGRMMFRGSLQRLDASEISGRVVVFTRAVEFAELTPGRPASFRARIGRPTRRDLTVAVLSATGKPKLGEAAPIHRVAHDIRAGFADAARVALPADQAAMLPSLVLGDTSTLSAQTTEEFRRSGLTHLTAVSGANVTIVCGAVLMTAALFGPRVAVALAAVALAAFVIVVQPSASVLRAAVMGAITLLAVVSHRRRQAIPV